VLTVNPVVHLTAILENVNVSTMKPEATQVLLQQALREHPSDLLEVASNGYHVRRKPSSYPPKYLPHNSFEDVNDDGLSFWDQRTIYVEPHLRNLCQTPARVAHWLEEHGQLRSKWLPIQAVHTLYNSVIHEDGWSKWRTAEKPDDWKVMTKVEHTKRTAEYVALLEKQNPRGKSKNMVDEAMVPAIARPAVLAMNAEIAPTYTEAVPPKAKRKRNRKKGDKVTTDDTKPGADAAAKGGDDDEPSSKRRG
jgi:hypothetical protein